MFNKLKQIKNLRDKAKVIQSALSEEMVEHSSKGIAIKMDGNQIVKSIVIDEKLLADKARLETALAETMNEIIKKVQKKMALKLQQMGGLDLPGLS